MTRKKIEEGLANSCRRQYAMLTGNGTSALWLALRAAGITGKRVAVPAAVCPNVPLSVLYSGNTPVFFDVSAETFSLRPEDLEKHRDRYDAVIFVHGNGCFGPAGEVADVCRKHGKFMIEDVAVAQGAGPAGSPAGSYGDVSVLSFGAGKIVSIGHGGAVFCNDSSLADGMRKMESHFDDHGPEHKAGINKLAQHYRNLYNAHYGTESWASDSTFSKMADECRSSFFYRFHESYEMILSRKLDEIGDNISSRSENASVLTGLFRTFALDSIRIHEPPGGSVYWRYNIFISKKRNEVLRCLLKKKLPVSSWYPSVGTLFGDRAIRMDLTVSDSIGDEILNIWVNDEINSQYLLNIVNEIAKINT